MVPKGARVSGVARIALAAAGLAAIVASAEVRLVTQTCEDEKHFLQESWRLIVQEEKALGEAFNKMADLKAKVDPQAKTLVSSCRISWPEENGRPVDGVREAVLDMQWIDDGRAHHHGIRLQYDKRETTAGTRRTVTSLEVCRTPERCRAMGIPGTPPPSRPISPRTWSE